MNSSIFFQSINYFTVYRLLNIMSWATDIRVVIGLGTFIKIKKFDI